MYGDDDYSSDSESSIFGTFLEGIKDAQLNFYDKALSIASFIDSIVLNSIEAVEGSSSTRDNESDNRDSHTTWFPLSFNFFRGSCFTCGSFWAPILTFFITLGVLSSATFLYLKRKQQNAVQLRNILKSQIRQSTIPSFSPLGREPDPQVSEGSVQQSANVSLAEVEKVEKADANLTELQRNVNKNTVEKDVGKKKKEEARICRNVSFSQNVDTSLICSENNDTRQTHSKKRKLVARGKTVQTMVVKDNGAPVTSKGQSKSKAVRVEQRTSRNVSTSPKTRSRGYHAPTWSLKKGSPGKCSTAEFTGGVSSNPQTAPKPRQARQEPRKSERSVTQRSSSAVLLSSSSRATLEKTPSVLNKSEVLSFSDRHMNSKKDEALQAQAKQRASKKLITKAKEAQVKRKTKQSTFVPGLPVKVTPRGLPSTAKNISFKISKAATHNRICSGNVGEMRKPFTLDMKSIRESPSDSMIKNVSYPIRRSCRKHFTNSRSKAMDGLQRTRFDPTSVNNKWPPLDCSLISAMFTSASGETSWSSRLIKPVAMKEHTHGCLENYRIRKTDTPQLKSLTGEGAFMSYSKSWSLDATEAPNKRNDYNSKQIADDDTSQKRTNGDGTFDEDETDLTNPANMNLHKPEPPLLENVNVNSWLGLWSEHGVGDVDLVNSLIGRNACIRPEPLVNKRKIYSSLPNPVDDQNLFPYGYKFCSKKDHKQNKPEHNFNAATKKPGRINLHPWPSFPQQGRRHCAEKEPTFIPKCKGQGFNKRQVSNNLKSSTKHEIYETYPANVDQSKSRVPYRVKSSDTYTLGSNSKTDLCGSDSETSTNKYQYKNKAQHLRHNGYTCQNPSSDYEYVYVLKDDRNNYKSRKRNLKSKLGSRIEPYQLQSRYRILSKHRMKPTTARHGHPGRRNTVRGSDPSEDDVIHVLENGLVRPCKLSNTKSKDVKKQGNRTNRSTPYPEQDRGSLQNMLQELQNLSKEQVTIDKRRKDSYSKKTQKYSTDPEKRSSYCASDEDSSSQSKQQRTKAARLPSFHRCYTKNKRFRPHRQKPYCVEPDYTSCSLKNNSVKRLNKNNCSPSKGKRFVLMPGRERKTGIHTDFPLHMDGHQNPGYDCRSVVVDGETLAEKVMFDPYGHQPIRRKNSEEQTELTKFLWPNSETFDMKQENRAMRKGNRCPIFWEPLSSDNFDGAPSQVEQKMWLRHSKRQQKARIPFDFRLSSLVKDVSANSTIDSEKSSYSECQTGAMESNGGAKHTSPRCVFQSTQTEPLENSIEGMSAIRKCNITKIDNSSQVMQSVLKSVGVQTSPIENSPFFQIKSSPNRLYPKVRQSNCKVNRPLRARHSMRRPKLRGRYQMNTSGRSSDSFKVLRTTKLKGVFDEQINRKQFQETSATSKQAIHTRTTHKQTDHVDQSGANIQHLQTQNNEETFSNTLKHKNGSQTLSDQRPAVYSSKSRNIGITRKPDPSPEIEEGYTESANKEKGQNVGNTPSGQLLSEYSEQFDSIHLDKTYSVRKSSSVQRDESNCPPKIARFNTCPPKSSGIQDRCLVRPMWKNADVNELDKRVKRALKLREELQLCKQSKQDAKSKFLRQQCGSPISNDSVNTEDLRPSDTDEVPSCQLDTTFGLDQTNDTISPRKDRSRSPTDASTVRRDPNGVFNFHTSSPAAEHAAAGSSHTNVISMERTDLQATKQNSKERQQDCDSSGRCRKRNNACWIDRTFSLHDTTSQPLDNVPERPSSAGNYSTRNDSNNSDSRERHSRERQKNTPPTKISKVDNVVPSGNTKLVGELVETLPHVPMLSFVEWFIETSDPRNYTEASIAAPSSSSENCVRQKPSAAKAKDVFNEHGQVKSPIECKSILKDTLPLRNTSLEKSTVAEANNVIRSSYFTGLTGNDPIKNLHFKFSSKSETYPTFAPERQTIDKDGSGSNSILRKECKTENDSGKKSPKLKVRKIRDMMKSPLGSVATPCPRIKQVKFPNTRSTLSSGYSKTFKNTSHRHPFECTMFGEGHVSEDKAADVRNTVLQSGARPRRYLSPEPGVFSQKVNSEINGKSDAQPGLNKSLTDRTWNETKLQTESDKSRSRNTQPYAGSRGSSPRRNRCSPDFQFCSGSPYMFQMPDGGEDIEPGEKCAPGIRQILMKLRNNKETEDTVPLSQPEKMRITLKKSSDVTGIIAKFQGSSHRK